MGRTLLFVHGTPRVLHKVIAGPSCGGPAFREREGGVLEQILLAVGLSMDAFAVAVCKGLSMERAGLREAAAVGAWFGAFQVLMPAAGCLMGLTFRRYIVAVDHWIAFFLLAAIGGNMIREALFPEEDKADPSLRPREMLPLAVATSIDALAVGVTFAFLPVSLPSALGWIGGVTFLLSAAGVLLGGRVGARSRRRAELAGGGILIFLGLKILLEHLHVLPGGGP